MFVPLFRRHTALIKHAFYDASSEELQQLEVVVKRSVSVRKILPKRKVILSLDNRLQRRIDVILQKHGYER
jgi:hypothetical protein